MTVIRSKLVSDALVRVKGDSKVILMVDLPKRMIFSSLLGVAVRLAAWKFTILWPCYL